MDINGESLTGVFIETYKNELKNAMLYKKVEIISEENEENK
jgi:hypothetical protein